MQTGLKEAWEDYIMAWLGIKHCEPDRLYHLGASSTPSRLFPDLGIPCLGESPLSFNRSSTSLATPLLTPHQIPHKALRLLQGFMQQHLRTC